MRKNYNKDFNLTKSNLYFDGLPVIKIWWIFHF